jgi:NADH pyrophosphatase NudC (nudix superfamily)
MLSFILVFIFSHASRNDLDFRRAVEDFVIANSRYDSIPEPQATLLRAWEGGCYKCREQATRKLRRACRPPEDRWLFWATKSRDAEVRMRAISLLRSIHSCRFCYGLGLCESYLGDDDRNSKCVRCDTRFYSHTSPESSWGACYPCVECKSEGTLWRQSYE